jgi:hypothetical protein
MDFVNNRCRDFRFSLHDSRIREIKYNGSTLILKPDHLFQYTEDEEKVFSGEILFDKCDPEECSVWVFDQTVYRGDFSGKAIGIEEYMKRFSCAEFEILTEGHFGYDTTLTGWIWEDGKKPVSAVIYIWNSGNMIYRIDG